MKKYNVTYSVNGNEIRKSIELEDQDNEKAIERACDSLMWPIEFHEEYSDMRIVVEIDDVEIFDSFNDEIPEVRTGQSFHKN